MNMINILVNIFTTHSWNIANQYICLAGETDECDIPTPSTAQQWLPYVVVFSFRVLGKDFSLNASFTAHCSGSTKSIHILNRKQRMKHVKEKERQNVGNCQEPWARISLIPGSLPALRLQAKRKGLYLHIYLPCSGFIWQWGSGSGSTMGNSGQVQFWGKLIDQLG